MNRNEFMEQMNEDHNYRAQLTYDYVTKKEATTPGFVQKMRDMHKSIADSRYRKYKEERDFNDWAYSQLEYERVRLLNGWLDSQTT